MDLDPEQTHTAASSAPRSMAKLRVEGKFLVVKSGVVLPPICVITNTALQRRDVLQKSLSWWSPIDELLATEGITSQVLENVFSIRKCVIAFGLSPDIRKKYLYRRIFKVSAAIALLFTLPYAATLESTNLAYVLLFLCALAAGSLYMGNSPLRIDRYRHGEFWITGCSKEFLSRFDPGE